MLKKIDEMGACFKFFNSYSVYTTDKNLICKGDGVYSSEDWGFTREKNDSLFSLPNTYNYYKSIFLDGKKLCSVSNLIQNFKLEDFSLVGDIGGVPFSQAWAMKQLCPGLKFILTDYDSRSIESLMNLSIFSSDYRLHVFDAKKDDYLLFDDCDLLTMWGVDYALEDADLIRLFKYTQEMGKKLLIATLDVDTGHTPWTFVKRMISQLIQKNQARLSRKRFHGMMRNSRYINLIAERACANCRTVMADGLYRVYEIT